MAPACTACRSSVSSAPKFLLTCLRCNRAWHHRCHRPVVSDAELMLIFTRFKQAVNAGQALARPQWTCAACSAIPAQPPLAPSPAISNEPIVIDDDSGDEVIPRNTPSGLKSSAVLVASKSSGIAAKSSGVATKSTGFSTKSHGLATKSSGIATKGMPPPSSRSTTATPVPSSRNTTATPAPSLSIQKPRPAPIPASKSRHPQAAKKSIAPLPPTPRRNPSIVSTTLASSLGHLSVDPKPPSPVKVKFEPMEPLPLPPRPLHIPHILAAHAAAEPLPPPLPAAPRRKRKDFTVVYRPHRDGPANGNGKGKARAEVPYPENPPPPRASMLPFVFSADAWLSAKMRAGPA